MGAQIAGYMLLSRSPAPKGTSLHVYLRAFSPHASIGSYKMRSRSRHAGLRNHCHLARGRQRRGVTAAAASDKGSTPPTHSALDPDSTTTEQHQSGKGNALLRALVWLWAELKQIPSLLQEFAATSAATTIEALQLIEHLHTPQPRTVLFRSAVVLVVVAAALTYVSGMDALLYQLPAKVAAAAQAAGGRGSGPVAAVP